MSKQAKQVLKALENVSPGDLIAVEWCDASVGKSSGSGMLSMYPFKSWGIFVGLIGDRVKHIVLAQNSFRYADGLYDLDYTAIPVGWQIEWEHFDFETNTIRITPEKNSNPRIFKVSHKLIGMLHQLPRNYGKYVFA